MTENEIDKLSKELLPKLTLLAESTINELNALDLAGDDQKSIARSMFISLLLPILFAGQRIKYYNLVSEASFVISSFIATLSQLDDHIPVSILAAVVRVLMPKIEGRSEELLIEDFLADVADEAYDINDNAFVRKKFKTKRHDTSEPV